MGDKSAAEIIILLFAGGVGTGVLVLPRAMAATGYLLNFLLLVIGSLISATTTWMLFMGVTKVRADAANQGDANKALLTEKGAESKTPVEGPSYGELLTAATVPAMSLVLDLLLLFYAGGAVTTYYLFLASFVQDLPFWPEALEVKSTVVLMAVLTYGPTLAPSIGALSKVSNIVLVVLFCLVFGIWYRAPAAAAQRSEPLSAIGDLETVGAALSTAIYAYVWHNNCVAIAREIRDPTPARCAFIALSATTLLCLAYAFVAFGGYWSFGDELRSMAGILNAYPKNDPLFIALRIAMTCSLMVAIDLNIFPLRESCIGLVRKVSPGYQTSRLSHGMWSFLLIFCTAGFGILYPTVTQVISFLGGAIGPFMCIVFPVVISRMYLSKPLWFLALLIFVPITVFLNLAGYGLVGKPV